MAQLKSLIVSGATRLIGKMFAQDIQAESVVVAADPTQNLQVATKQYVDNTIISGGGEVNQNAFSNVKVGSTTVAADTKTDTLELVAGTNVTLTPDATNDKITITATDTTYTAASATPLMDGTAAAGTSTKYAREDHVHPVDTSRAAASHTHSAYVNQNAFSNVKVGSTTIAADTATDTVQLVAGNNITLTPDATNDKVTIAATDTTYTAATAAPGNVASSSSAGTSTNYARQDHTHGITLATGDSNGQVKIAGSNVSVKGWNTAATYDVETTVANDSKLPTGAAVKSFVEGKGYITTDTNTRRAFYGTCATAAATKDKVVTLSNTTGWELLPGTIVGVKFTYTNTYASATDSPITLNVNNTGAKNIWYNTTHSGAGNTGTNTTIYGSANRINYYMYDGTYWVWLSFSLSANDNTVPTAYCTTAAGTAAKTATCTNYNLLAKSYTILLISTTNTAASALTLNINSKGAKPIYINGSASSASNYTMPAGSYLVYYDGTNYYIRTDGKITGSITGDAATVNGKTVGVNVPADAKFTDTVVTKTSELTNDSNFVVDSGYVHTDNNYTTTEKNKLAGIAAGAEVNVQSDWNVTDSSSDAFIKNKPTIPTDTWKAYYGTCSTAAATAAKVVTVSSDQNFSLRVGTVIGVKFTISNTAGSVTLNVNSTGAKSIWYNNAAYTGTSTDITGYANRLNYYMYDGTYWVFMTAGNTFNANTYDRTYLSSNGYKAKSAIVAANIIVAGSDGLYFHLKTGDPFDITYPILYANSACNADATNNGGYTIIPFTVTTTQSITLTAYKAVYIKGTLSGTTFTPVSTTPLTQTVPTSNDGYQYILLGRALNSTTLMYLLSEHPIYEYSGGSFHEVARNADKVNGHTVAADVPSSAVFTDTQSDWNVTTTTSAAFIKNKPAIESTFTLSLASTAWSSTTTTVNSIPYYTATVTASSLVKEYPTIYCGSSSTLPSKDEKDAFNLINYAIADLANHTITFYAVIKPTINLTIKVIG